MSRRRISASGSAGHLEWKVPDVKNRITKTCPVMEGGTPCGRPLRARGWCRLHYERWKRTGDAYAPPAPGKGHIRNGRTDLNDCVLCGEPVYARGWCKKHYDRNYFLGDPEFCHEIICEFCSETFSAEPRQGQLPAYCPDRDCKNEAAKARRNAAYIAKQGGEARWFLCQWCQEPFEGLRKPGHPPAYCCDEHRRLMACERTRQWNLTNADRRAHRLRSTLLERRRAYREKYAQDAEFRAVELARALSRRHSPLRRAREALRSALVRGAPYGDQFDPWEVFERDGWICYLCSELVDPNATQRMRRPSLDHIVPCSKGGPHTRENTALAHVWCNCSKHARDLADFLASRQ